jgi:lipopolysaccharide transport system permease protein
MFYGLNPMVGVVEGIRWALLGVGQGPSLMLAASTLIALFVFISGMIWFQRREEKFIDTLGSGG